MNNQDIYLKNPLKNHLANNGVVEVNEDRSSASLNTLHYELSTFVCDGQYQQGIETILRTYLDNLDAPEQPAVWISGFYGSGKSHLAKMLRVFWIDEPIPGSGTARSIAQLPDSIKQLLIELSTEGKRLGGLHAAAGKLGASANNNIRIALLGMIFKSAGLPEQVHQARFILWLREQGLHEQLQAELSANGESLQAELPHLYVSPVLANALLKVYPELADNGQGARQLLKAQFPTVTDVSSDEMVNDIRRTLTTDGKFPLTLVVLDEVQQYLNDDGDKTILVQEVTETCSKHFGGRLLFIGTGQMALSSTTNLQKLLARFKVPIALSDADVDRVIRTIILAKKPTAVPAIEAMLNNNLGEISRHLSGTRIAHHNDDEAVMVQDYPMLPTRRRFWERLLHSVDTTGTESQLRNQLHIVHEAAKYSATDPIGHVIGGDFIYNQIAPNLLQTAVLSREVFEHIQAFSAGDAMDQLKARLLKLIFLINKLPSDSVADIGLRPDPDTLADLLVTDLPQGSAQLRKDIPPALEQLQDQHGLVMAVGDQYRLQTAESSAWHDEYRRQQTDLKHNLARLDHERIELFKARCQETLKQVHITQGDCNEPRKLHPSFDPELPKDHASRLIAWFQDGWTNSEKNLIADAHHLGNSDPTLLVFIPARHKTELNNAIVAAKAATQTIELRGTPATTEGEDARAAMATRLNDAKRQIDSRLSDIFSAVQVYQAGGQQRTEDKLAEKLSAAANDALIRLYPQFDTADHIAWGKVYERAKKGDGRALEAIDHHGDADKQPVAAALLKYLAPGRKGADLREHFKQAPYGWPQDAIDGALFALLASGHLLAEDNSHNAIEVGRLDRARITQTYFKPESVTISPVQLIQIRKLFQAAGIHCPSGEEQATSTQLLTELRQRAQAAGGDAPRPAVPDQSGIDQLALRSGNALLAELYEQRSTLTSQLSQWQQTAAQISQRMPTWHTLQALLKHARELGPGQALITEADAIRDQRALLTDPDPAHALLDQATTLLRTALDHQLQQYKQLRDQGLAQLTADSQWQQLDPGQQQQLLSKHGLDHSAQASTSSADDLLESLHNTPLDGWEDRRKALPPRFNDARMEAARLLLPKVQHLGLPHRTLHNDSDLDSWLAEVKNLVQAKLKDGPVML